ncbi:hypothetical protein ACFQ6N_12935 [Kitasatospora sp. NPDC056446]|uniref:hypothetical protein n=1 Tax=Kitasatospora sp. NPDC056446 TaxID=3345819 RepID=UPI0036A19CD0
MHDPQDPAPLARLPEQEAIDLVRRHIRRNGFDTTGYQLSTLRAQRFDVGWMVYSPGRPGEIRIDRAIFYVGDDGELEHSTSAVTPSVYITGFEERFLRRHGVNGG